MSTNRGSALWLGLAALALSFVAEAQQAPAYSVELIARPGRVIQATAINNSGTIAGQAQATYNYAFSYSGGVLHNLGTLQYESNVRGLNEAGDAVGYSFIADMAPFGIQRAVSFHDGSAQDLGTLGGTRSWANGINNDGQIVGWAERANGTRGAFLYDNGSMQDLGAALGIAGETEGLQINDAGQITLSSGSSTLLYSGGVLQDIGTLGGWTYANAMNEDGRVVGFSYTGGPGQPQHAFSYADGSMVDLGVLAGANWSNAYDVNLHDQVVGASGGRAFVYADGSMRDLNLLLDSSSPLALFEVLQEAVAINDFGTIVAQSSTGAVYLLTPVPLPAAIWLFSGAVAALGMFTRRKA